MTVLSLLEIIQMQLLNDKELYNMSNKLDLQTPLTGY